jgi:hypothetical protein
VSLICDVAFCPRDPTIIAVAGKEHLGWWKIDVAKGSIDLVLTPDYQVIFRRMQSLSRKMCVWKTKMLKLM